MTKPPLTVAEARARITRMRPGDRFAYFTGYLPVAKIAHASVAELADFMLLAGTLRGYIFARDDTPIEGLGLGHLTQERIRAFMYVYLFTKA